MKKIEIDLPDILNNTSHYTAIDIKNALYTYCEWNWGHEGYEHFNVHPNPYDPIIVVITLERKMAEVFKSASNRYLLSMYEEFSDEKNYDGFLNYLKSWLKMGN